MNKELKEKWIKALRSGEYKQGKTVLKSKESCFCCLGVLCDIIDPTAWVMNDSNGTGVIFNYNYKDKLSTTQLPASLSHELNLSRYESPLVILNDSGETFSYIADWIEENIPAD